MFVSLYCHLRCSRWFRGWWMSQTLYTCGYNKHVQIPLMLFMGLFFIASVKHAYDLASQLWCWGNRIVVACWGLVVHQKLRLRLKLLPLFLGSKFCNYAWCIEPTYIGFSTLRCFLSLFCKWSNLLVSLHVVWLEVVLPFRWICCKSRWV